jgi:hypothetical protein
MILQEKIEKLETSLPPGTVPGTAIARVLVDKTLLAKPEYDVAMDAKDRESAILWCISYGSLMQPWKEFFYGRTIDEAVDKALRFIGEKV